MMVCPVIKLPVGTTYSSTDILYKSFQQRQLKPTVMMSCSANHMVDATLPAASQTSGCLYGETPYYYTAFMVELNVFFLYQALKYS